MHSLRAHHKLFSIFILASIGVHALVLFTMYASQYFSFSPKSFEDHRPVEIEFVSIPKKDTDQKSVNRQIVQSEDSSSSEQSEGAFLSDKTRTFDRQTRAANTGTFNKAGKGNANITQKAQAGSNSIAKQSPTKTLRLSDIGMASEVAETQKQMKKSSQDAQAGRMNGDESSFGLSATSDYVEDVALGDFTQMNTVEFKFYGFYHRIRQKLEQHWGRSIHEKADAIFRAGRRLPASENFVTNLQVTLNAQGEIVAVKILGASGVRELDDAAIESFNQAGPFPNPPKELLKNGHATIDWGFVVKG